MGIYERDYTHGRTGGRSVYSRIISSAVWTIIALDVAIWFVQAFTFDRELGSDPLTRWFGASAATVFGGLQIWRPLTANFLHDPSGLGHVFLNLLALFVFGRELERLYGRRDFWILFLAAGTLAVLAELITLQLGAGGGRFVPVIGASGAVMAVVVIFTLHFPKRIIYLNLLIPIPVWVLCVLWVTSDLLAAMGGESGVANFAHLTGAFIGFLYWRFDLRWPRLRRWVLPARRPRARQRRAEKIIEFPGRPPRGESQSVAEISERIDHLLAKISREGKDSLTAAELEFLKENSGSYRSSSH